MMPRSRYMALPASACSAQQDRQNADGDLSRYVVTSTMALFACNIVASIQYLRRTTAPIVSPVPTSTSRESASNPGHCISCVMPEVMSVQAATVAIR